MKKFFLILILITSYAFALSAKPNKIIQVATCTSNSCVKTVSDKLKKNNIHVSSFKFKKYRVVFSFDWKKEKNIKKLYKDSFSTFIVDYKKALNFNKVIKKASVVIEKKDNDLNKTDIAINKLINVISDNKTINYNKPTTTLIIKTPTDLLNILGTKEPINKKKNNEEDKSTLKASNLPLKDKKTSSDVIMPIIEKKGSSQTIVTTKKEITPSLPKKIIDTDSKLSLILSLKQKTPIILVNNPKFNYNKEELLKSCNWEDWKIIENLNHCVNEDYLLLEKLMDEEEFIYFLIGTLETF